MSNMQNQNKYVDEPYDNTGMTVKDWIVTFLIMLIPVFNILYIIKNMTNNNNPSYKRNYFKAYLVYFIVAFIISLILSIVL
jgi:hypothetical protein